MGAEMATEVDQTTAHVGLRRSLTFWPLLLYGLAIIVGAGIFVATASVIGRVGPAAPVSFLLAGITAGLTGLCYAELSSRFPEAAGAAAFVKEGFNSDRAAQMTGVALTLAVAVAAASVASGAVHYLSVFIRLPPAALIAVLIVAFTLLAIAGVRESAIFAAAIGTVEILGLVIAAWAGFLSAPSLDVVVMLPTSVAAWQGVVAGAFIAFFAFIGFESLVNMAEETKDPRRTVPYAIVGAILVCTLLYVVVAASLVLAGRGGESPLLDLFQGNNARLFAAVGALAVANGVLVEIMMLARLFYGMAQRRQLPAALGRVNPRTRTPIEATAVAGGIVLVTALLLPFEQLLALANALTLSIFATVDIALWRIQRRQPPVEGVFSVPQWVPLAGATFSVGMIVVAAAT